MSPEWWTVIFAALGALGSVGSVCIFGGVLIQKQREHGETIHGIKDELRRSREEFRKDMQETRDEFRREAENIRDDAKAHTEEDKKAFAVLFDRTATHTAENGFAKEQIGGIKAWLATEPWSRAHGVKT